MKYKTQKYKRKENKSKKQEKDRNMIKIEHLISSLHCK